VLSYNEEVYKSGWRWPARCDKLWYQAAIIKNPDQLVPVTHVECSNLTILDYLLNDTFYIDLS